MIFGTDGSYFSSVTTLPLWLEAVRAKEEEASRGTNAQQQATQRARLREIRSRLDQRVYVYWQRDSREGVYVPIPPGEEYPLLQKYEFVRDQPRIGQTTIDISRISSLGSLYPDGYEPVRPSSGLTLAPPRAPAVPVPVHLRYPGHPPSHSIGRIPSMGEATYSGYVDWSPSAVLLGCNTTRFPPPPPQTNATMVFDDGYWGRKECSLFPWPFDRRAPWLAYIPLEHDHFRTQLSHHSRDEVWTAVVRELPIYRETPDGRFIDGHRQHLSNQKGLRAELRTALISLWSSLSKEFEAQCGTILETRNHLNRDVSDVDLPRSVVHRALQAFGRLTSGVDGWIHFVLALRCFERCMLEIEGFLAWCKDVRSYPTPVHQAGPSPVLRGSTFSAKDFDLFLSFAHMHVPVYIIDDTGQSWDHVLHRVPVAPVPSITNGESLYCTGEYAKSPNSFGPVTHGNTSQVLFNRTRHSSILHMVLNVWVLNERRAALDFEHTQPTRHRTTQLTLRRRRRSERSMSV